MWDAGNSQVNECCCLQKARSPLKNISRWLLYNMLFIYSTDTYWRPTMCWPLFWTLGVYRWTIHKVPVLKELTVWGGRNRQIYSVSDGDYCRGEKWSREARWGVPGCNGIFGILNTPVVPQKMTWGPWGDSVGWKEPKRENRCFPSPISIVPYTLGSSRQETVPFQDWYPQQSIWHTLGA